MQNKVVLFKKDVKNESKCILCFEEKLFLKICPRNKKLWLMVSLENEKIRPKTNYCIKSNIYYLM